jgi:hypothetical protein
MRTPVAGWVRTDLDTLLATIEAERLTGATAFVDHLTAKNGLKTGQDTDHARDIVWAHISPELCVL